MSKKTNKLMNKAMRKGMSPVEIAAIKELARKESQRMENQASEKAFLYLLSIPAVILAKKYWVKTANRRISRFVEDVLNMYEKVQNGEITVEQLAEELYDIAGCTVEVEWLKPRDKGEDANGRCKMDKDGH